MDQAGIATLAITVVLIATAVGTIGTPLIVDAVDVQPDSTLYSLERAGESIKGVFVGGQDWEIERAQERDDEFVYMVDAGKAGKYTWLVGESDVHLLKAAKLADDNEGLQRAIEANVSRLVLLENVKERVPAKAKPAISFAQLQSYASVRVLENVAGGVYLKIPEPLKVELDNQLNQIRVRIENLRIENKPPEFIIRIENYGKLRLEVENVYAISVIENLHVIWGPKPVENIEIKFLTSLRIEPANAWLGVGDFVDFTATAVYSDESTEDMTCVATWGLSNPAIGKLCKVYTLCLDHPCYAAFHAEETGYTWITASYHGYSDSIPVVVSESPPPAAFGELKLTAFADERKVLSPIFMENVEITIDSIEDLYFVNVGAAITVGDMTTIFLGDVYAYFGGAHGIEKGDNLTGFGTLRYGPQVYIDAFSDGFWISKFSISIENIIVTPENLENTIIIMEKIWLEDLDKVENIAVSLAGPTPDHWDWRSRKGGDWATPVRYQGSCGSCWAFGAIASVESCVNIKADDPDLDMNLSEQYLLSCSPGGCDGWYLSYTLDWMKEHGAILESCFPYRADDTIPCAEKCTNWERKLVKVQDWHWVKSDKESIKNALIRHGPLPTCMLIYKDFFRYMGGIYHHESEDILGVHAVTIVGYDDRNEYWMCKNSWGVDWGESGWFKIGYGECQIEERTAYLDVVIKPSYSFGNDYVVVDSDAATEPSEVTHIYYVDIPLAVDSFMVEICDGDELTVEVYDPDGNLVENKQGFADDAWNSLDISSSLPGTYMVKIYDQHDYWWSYGNGYRLDVTTTSDANLRLYSYHTCLDQGDGSAEVWVEVPQGTSFFTLSNYDMDDKGKLTIYRPDGTIYGVYGGPSVISGNEEWERLSINSAEYPGFWELHFSDLGGAKAFLVEVGTLVSTSEGSIVVETSENFEITIGENVAWDPVMEAHFYSLLKLHHKSVPLPEE